MGTGNEALVKLQSVLGNLIPAIQSVPARPLFYFGRYRPSDFIDLHNDEGTYAAFWNESTIYSRRVALIWYLTKNWTYADGGTFVDDELIDTGGISEIVPTFNDAVLFL